MASEADPLRVVFDSNVLISALAWHVETRALWGAVEQERVALVVSPFILKEFVKVLKTKLRIPQEQIDLLADEIIERAEVVVPTSHITEIKAKDSDNRILECAVDAGVKHLVTGDMKHVRPLGIFRGITILTPGEFKKMLPA